MSRVVLKTRDGRRWRVADVGGRLAFVVVRRWPHRSAGRWPTLAGHAAMLATALDGAVDRGAAGLLTGAAAARVRAAGAGLWAEGGR